MPESEKKPDVTPPAGSEATPPAPNQGPSAEELQKQNQKLQDDLKERDSKISDLSTTVATIEERMRQINQAPKTEANKDLQARAKKILEAASFDPDGASAELTTLLSEIQSGATKGLDEKVSSIVNQQTVLTNLKAGVKSSNPDFDDDVVDTIMERANQLAVIDRQSGRNKYKSAQEAIDDAVKFVKSKFDAYAQKKNATPSLPPGARAEDGSNRPPDAPKSTPKALTPLEELEERKKGLQKKII